MPGFVNEPAYIGTDRRVRAMDRRRCDRRAGIGSPWGGTDRRVVERRSCPDRRDALPGAAGPGHRTTRAPSP